MSLSRDHAVTVSALYRKHFTVARRPDPTVLATGKPAVDTSLECRQAHSLTDSLPFCAWMQLW